MTLESSPDLPSQSGRHGRVGDWPSHGATIFGPFGSGRFDDSFALWVLNSHIRRSNPNLLVRAIDGSCDSEGLTIASIATSTSCTAFAGGIPVDPPQTPQEQAFSDQSDQADSDFRYHVLIRDSAPLGISWGSILKLSAQTFTPDFISARMAFMRFMAWAPQGPFVAAEKSSTCATTAAAEEISLVAQITASDPTLEVFWFSLPIQRGQQEPSDAEAPADAEAPSDKQVRLQARAKAGQSDAAEIASVGDVVSLLATSAAVVAQERTLEQVAKALGEPDRLTIDAKSQRTIADLDSLLQNTECDAQHDFCETSHLALQAKTETVRRASISLAALSLSAQRKQDELQDEINRLNLELAAVLAQPSTNSKATNKAAGSEELSLRRRLRQTLKMPAP